MTENTEPWTACDGRPPCRFCHLDDPDGDSSASLTEFLLARIAEDERAARQGVALEDPRSNVYGSFDPERVLAECEAKRRTVTLHSARVMGGVDDCGFACRNTRCPTLALVALPYAEHPDYRDEWRP